MRATMLDDDNDDDDDAERSHEFEWFDITLVVM